MKNDFYKSFFVYDFCDDLKNIDCFSSSFILNWKTYFEDEEFIENDKFIKCPYCCYEHIKRIYVPNRNFETFLKQYDISYPKTEYCYWKNTLELLTILDGYAYVDICENCRRIISVNDKPFFFYYHISATDYEKLYVKEDLFTKEFSPKYCPSCHSRNFFSEEDYKNEKLEHMYCVRCKSYICEKYLEKSFFINMNYLGKKIII